MKGKMDECFIAKENKTAIIHENGGFTKQEVVAMLADIQLEIEELDSRAGYGGSGMPTYSTDYVRKKKVIDIIQQKINALKGENNGIHET